MSFESELRDKLVCLAECRIDLTAWNGWWSIHSTEAKEIVSSSDFLYLNCVPSSYGPSSTMVKCQKGAERYLIKKKIPFQHSDIYLKGADEEQRLYRERLEQQRKAQQEEKQMRYKQRAYERKELIDYKIPYDNMKKSGLRTLPISANDVEIIKLLMEWTEFLAQEKYKEALEMFLLDENNELDWTPELLESAVYTYGCPGYTREEAEKEFGSADYIVTSILDNPDKAKIIADIDISSDYGWMGKDDIAVIHYDNVPLNGKMSDLTARFFVRKIDDNNLTLAFIDLHVL